MIARYLKNDVEHMMLEQFLNLQVDFKKCEFCTLCIIAQALLTSLTCLFPYILSHSSCFEYKSLSYFQSVLEISRCLSIK